MRFLFILLFLNLKLYSQIIIEGTIIDKKTNLPILGSTIYNLNKNKGCFSGDYGAFSIVGDVGDLIQVTHLGYTIKEFYISHSNNPKIIELEPFVKILKPAYIYEENLAKKSILYNHNYNKEKTTHKTTIFDYKTYKNNISNLKTPFSYIYYATNKREQRRLEYLEKIQKREIANQIYDYYFISSVTKIYDEEEVNNIKIHCYFNEDEILNSTTYQLAIKLKSCYLDYIIWKNDRERYLRILNLKEKQKQIDSMIKRSNETKLDSLGNVLYQDIFVK